MSRFLLINPGSGDDSPTGAELAAAAAEQGIDAHVLDGDDDVEELARRSDADVIGMAGGDGSLAPVAAAAIEQDSAFVVVPFGTRNHFARDIGLDADDPIGSLAAFEGRERRVDVGRIGDNLFLNNVSLGMYAELVHRREHHRRRRDAFARARAVFRLATGRGHADEFTIDGDRVSAPVVVVASNAYELDLFNIGDRKRLDDGLVHVYIAHGWLPRTWEERSCPHVTIDVPSHKVRAAIDGEPAELETPLEFRLEARALRVLLPSA